jgi:pimeloyl-ACP methyl ester carboxylesterase
VLLLSGELDPVTPPKFAEQAAQTLVNSRHLIVRGVGHNAGFTGCVPDLMVEFIEQLAPQELAAGCIDSIRRPPFFTSTAGPQSVVGGDG